MTAEVSVVENARAIQTRHASPAAVLEDIRTGKWKAEILAIQQASRTRGKTAAKALKQQLPGVLWSGTFRQRKASALIKHSGLLIADLDDVEEKISDIRERLTQSPHLFALFVSPTGTGLKAVFRVCNDPARHGESFRAVQVHVRTLAEVEIDESGKDVSRLCFVSFDPQLYTPERAPVPLVASVSQEPFPVARPKCHTDIQTYRLSDIQTHRPTDAQTHKSCVGMGVDTTWVDEFIPTTPHKTNSLFFLMARRSKAVEAELHRKLKPAELKQCFHHWYAKTDPKLLSEAEDAYFAEFCRIRSYARTPLDESPLQLAWKRALSDSPPPGIELAPERVRPLVALCAQLQVIAGTETFFLSCNSAGALLGVDPTQAHRWLRALIGLGLLDLVKLGDPIKRIASEYRYIHTLPEVSPGALRSEGGAR